MTLDQGIAAIAAALIVAAVAFIGGMITARQKKDELLLLAIQHLCGGTQERNVGISAIELYWNKNRHRELCISMLVGSAVYLLRESKQKDAQHEIYNLNRIMDFLLSKRKLYSHKSPVLVYYRYLDAALNDKLAEVIAEEKDESNRKTKELQGKKYRHGLWVEKSQLEKWHNQLNPGSEGKKTFDDSIAKKTSIDEKSIHKLYAARIHALNKGFVTRPKLITINNSNPQESMILDQNEWWYCVEGSGTLTIENNNNKQRQFVQRNGIIPLAKGTKLIINAKNQMPLLLLSYKLDN